MILKKFILNNLNNNLKILKLKKNFISFLINGE